MAVTLTEKAAKHINRYLERRGKGVGLRFGVRTTGCSGLAYKLEYVDEAGAEDTVFESPESLAAERASRVNRSRTDSSCAYRPARILTATSRPRTESVAR